MAAQLREQHLESAGQHVAVNASSAAYVDNIGVSGGLHPDFGAGMWDGGPIGIPFVTVPGTRPFVSMAFIWYGDESDAGPYPVPPNAPIEGGSASTGDRHVLVVDSGHCTLYELYYAWPQPDSSWQAGSGAVFPLTSNALRPDGCTSTDAAGLPISGLVRYDEVAAGAINHALRFTVPVPAKPTCGRHATMRRPPPMPRGRRWASAFVSRRASTFPDSRRRIASS